MRHFLVSVLAVILLAAAAPAIGQATYTYQGNPFDTAFAPYTTSMSVSGSFQVAAPLPASSVINLSASVQQYSFGDGIEVRNEGNSTICQFSVTTNAAGAITAYDIWLRESGAADPQHSLEARATTDLAGFASPNAGCGAAALNPFASVNGQPGVWTSPVRAIEPVPSLSQIGLGLFAALMAGFAVWRMAA